MNPRDDAPSSPAVARSSARPIATTLAVAAALGLLVSMVALSRDFGSTWDERALQKLGELIWDLYTGGLSRSQFFGSFELNFGYTRIYGLLVDFLSVALQHVLPDNIWVVRHYVIAVFGWTGVVFAFLTASRLFGPRAGWLAALLLISMPRYFADSMNNPKDLPFAVLMLAGSYYVITVAPRYPYYSWPQALKLALAIALAINVRSMGLMLLGYAAIGLGVAVIASRDWSMRHLGGTAGRFLAIAAIALVGGCVFWPWAQDRPLTRPFEAFFMASGFSWGNPSLFMGEVIPGSDVPWYYLPTWLAITTPIVVIAGMAFSMYRLALPLRSRIQLAAVWALVLFPSAAAMIRHLSLYDGIRHMLFVVPPMAVLAAAGWDLMLQSAQARARIAAVAAFVILIGEPIVFQIRNHPNQAAYFSPVAGGPRAAFARYDMDYWGNCLLQTTEWAAAQAERLGTPLGVAANAWEIALMDTARFESLYFRQQRHTGWHFNMILLKGTPENITAAAKDPGALYRVTTSDGTPLCVVLPGPEYPKLQGRLALR
jgi:dolichyl-phosphate-mannose-protein mannosyltransferase